MSPAVNSGVVVGGGGTGTGGQTGVGSPVGVVTPVAAGVTYTDRSTGNVWVNLLGTVGSWVPASIASDTLNGTTVGGSVGGTAVWRQDITTPFLKIYTITLTNWNDAGTTITWNTPFATDNPGFLPTGGIPSAYAIPAPTSKATFFLPSTSGVGAITTGVILVLGA